MPFDCFNDKDDTKPAAGITLGVTLAYRSRFPSSGSTQLILAWQGHLALIAGARAARRQHGRGSREASPGVKHVGRCGMRQAEQALSSRRTRLPKAERPSAQTECMF